MRALVDLALLQVMRDGLLRRSEAAELRWGDLEVHEDGSGRLHVVRSKTDQAGEGSMLYLGPAAVEALLAIRPQEAVIDPGASVFRLSAGQISRRIKAATKMAGLGDGFSAHSPRVGMAQDLSAAGAELPELMTAGRWESPTMPARYTQAQAAGRGAVARYYRGDLRKRVGPDPNRPAFGPGRTGLRDCRARWLLVGSGKTVALNRILSGGISRHSANFPRKGAVD